MSNLEPIGCLTIDTSVGKITGDVLELPNGKQVARFLGIPFAKQPVGDLRFEPLQLLDGKIDTDEGPFIANKKGPSAFQAQDSYLATPFPMSEECIHMGIWVPLNDEIQNEPGKILDQKLPVMFNIHGGAFVLGSGDEACYDMTHFAANHSAIGVSFNYRLNFFGFISIPGAIAENLGLLDQLFALKWTHENIGSFGGDQNNITLFGCSAGGASVHFHMANAESTPYFKRAIAISGVLNKEWCLTSRAEQKKKVTKLLNKLGCPKNSTNEQKKQFLKSVTAEQIVNCYPTELSLTGLQFGPVDVFESDNISRDFISKKPFLIGICVDEATMFADVMFVRKDTTSQTKLRRLISDAMSEKLFFEPLRNLLSELSEIPEVPTYVYLFDHFCAHSEIIPDNLMRDYYGKFHSQDILFVLSMVDKKASYADKLGEADYKVAQLFDGMIGSFLTFEEKNEVKLPVKKFTKHEQVVNKINEDGIQVENVNCLDVYKKVSLLRAAGAAILLKAFSDTF